LRQQIAPRISRPDRAAVDRSIRPRHATLDRCEMPIDLQATALHILCMQLCLVVTARTCAREFWMHGHGPIGESMQCNASATTKINQAIKQPHARKEKPCNARARAHTHTCMHVSVTGSLLGSTMTPNQLSKPSPEQQPRLRRRRARAPTHASAPASLHRTEGVPDQTCFRSLLPRRPVGACPLLTRNQQTRTRTHPCMIRLGCPCPSPSPLVPSSSLRPIFFCILALF
jgi:hypothetical protein